LQLHGWVLHSIITAADKSFHYEFPWSVAGSQVRDDWGRSAHRPDIKKTVNQSFTRKRPAMKNGVLHVPISDYDDNAAEVGCWKMNGKIRGEDNEVSGAVTCGVVHM
jgi:hypothetical protein